MENLCHYLCTEITNVIGKQNTLIRDVPNLKFQVNTNTDNKNYNLAKGQNWILIINFPFNDRGTMKCALEYKNELP